MKSIFRVVACLILSLLVLTSCNFSNGTSITTHNVTFDSNGGSPVEPQIIKHGEKIEKPADPTRDGYSFNNWTYNKEEWSFIGYVVTEDMTLLANWNANVYTLTLNNSNPNSGSITGAGSYKYDSEVTIAASPMTGYSFLGWYDSKNALISSQTSYTFKMGFDLTLTAKWNEGNKYLVTLNPNGGTVSQTNINVNYGKVYLLPTPERKGYSFNGWYEGSEMISDTGIWLYTSNKVFTASWSIINYTITYNLNGGINNSSNPSVYTVNDGVVFTNPTKQGYRFIGWFKNDVAIVNIPIGSIGDITIDARWTALKNTLTVTSDDILKGTVSIVSGTGYSGELISVVATPATDCVFNGWFCNSAKVSGDAEYTFVMPCNDYSLKASFLAKKEKEERYATKPFLSDDGKTVTYGIYPQKNVDDPLTISALDSLQTAEPNGWFIYNGYYYAKIIANPFDSESKFDNGTTISSGTAYWFKCEPIVWNVLENNEKCCVVSTMLLDANMYYSSWDNRIVDGQTVYANNYMYSDIRKWLNEDFYNSAFALGNNHISTTDVDNSAETTAWENNECACENTKDKVYLLSYQDYLNEEYGFLASTKKTDTRHCKATDWARAKGVSCKDIWTYRGHYWTRSPVTNDATYAYSIGYDGSYQYYNRVNSGRIGVRPSLSITL